MCLRYVLIGLLAALIVIYFKNQEGFAPLPLSQLAGPASLSDGLYLIQNKNGNVLHSQAFTPVMCNNWIFQNPSPPSKEAAWNLRKVSTGVYRLNKSAPHSQECLFAHENNQLRSYVTSYCDFNVCGMDNLAYGDELDPYSIRTYFKLINGPNNTILIQSLKNNQYVKFDGQNPVFTPNPEDECLFTFSKV